jgi:hypothetical protein
VIHLYAIVRAPLRETVRGIDDASVTTLPVGAVHAAVSRHSVPVAHSDQAALAHASAIDAIAAQVDALPVRFGSEHEDEQRLRERITAEEGLHERLERVAGHVEFVVRPATVPVGPAASAETVTGVGAGRAYLERRRARDLAANEARDAVRVHLRQVTEPLAGLATDVRETAGRHGPERCYLVARDAAEHFARRARDVVGPGGTFVVGGPWPPFTFASQSPTEPR